jgi:hypothetical protein
MMDGSVVLIAFIAMIFLCVIVPAFMDDFL